MTAPLREDTFKYGMPLLCAEWLTANVFLVGGGGGAASTGIKNRVLLAKYEHGVVSDQISELPLGSKAPVRSAAHPNGHDVVIGLTEEGCRHIQLDSATSTPSLLDVTDSPVLDAFETIHEEALCLLFSSDGRYLIAGFSGGWVQIWKWPEMTIHIKLREDAIFTALKDLDVSPEADPALLALTTAKGTAEIWDFNQGSALMELPKRGSQGERFVHSRFQPEASRPTLFTTAMGRSGSFLMKWQILNKDTVKLLRRIKLGSEAVSAFSAQRRVLIAATSEGNIHVLTVGRMLPMQTVRAAHMVFITAIAVPPKPDVAEFLTVSGDSSAKVTQIEYRSEMGLWLKRMIPYFIINLILICLAFYLLQHFESPTAKPLFNGEL